MSRPTSEHCPHHGGRTAGLATSTLELEAGALEELGGAVHGVVGRLGGLGGDRERELFSYLAGQVGEATRQGDRFDARSGRARRSLPGMDRAIFQSVFVGVGLALGVFLLALGLASVMGASGAASFFVAGGIVVVVALLAAAVLDVYLPRK